MGKRLVSNMDEKFEKTERAVYTKVAAFRAEEQRFLDEHRARWAKALSASDGFFVLVSETAKGYAAYVSGLSEEERAEHFHTFTALHSLHLRAVQEYAEIVTLIKNGFADGAFARWRSMYELSVISSFISTYGEPTAEKFIEASGTEDRYDWAMASGLFPPTKRHVTFGDIQKRCEMDSDLWREDYNVANQTVHASAQGTFDRLGGDDFVGRSDRGIAAPAIYSANTLALISTMLFSLYPEDSTMDGMYAIGKWLDVIMETYCLTHDELYPDEEPLFEGD